MFFSGYSSGTYIFFYDVWMNNLSKLCFMFGLLFIVLYVCNEYLYLCVAFNSTFIVHCKYRYLHVDYIQKLNPFGFADAVILLYINIFLGTTKKQCNDIILYAWMYGTKHFRTIIRCPASFFYHFPVIFFFVLYKVSQPHAISGHLCDVIANVQYNLCVALFEKRTHIANIFCMYVVPVCTRVLNPHEMGLGCRFGIV